VFGATISCDKNFLRIGLQVFSGYNFVPSAEVNRFVLESLRVGLITGEDKNLIMDER